jgi:lipopolysaccharide/colanic/teichoic acid biosynthesis glycosyltransferase
VNAYDESHYRRLDARPGLTGLWQVSGRCELSFEEMVELDLEYVRRQSIALDLKLLVQTIPAVLAGRGAG